MTTLQVWRADRPYVSVVLVSYQSTDWMDRTLRALVDNTPPCYEVIVIDNGSPPETVAKLQGIEGIDLVLNGANLGFGNACNQGATRARGRYILFLNPDALVHDGWLPPLLAVVDAEPDVAAAAPRLLNLDGTLQEAGALVFRHGLVLNYGDGDNPERPMYSFRRDVDYASAACLLVRRSAFNAVGGFDPAYSPAYMEDVDLCLALAAAGWRVVVVPESTVTHARWASGDQAGTVALVERNRPRFCARWGDELARRLLLPEDRDPVRMIGARDLMATERVLVVTRRVPELEAGAADAGLAHLVDAIRQAWPSSRVTVGAESGSEKAALAMMRRGIEVDAAVSDWASWLDARRHHYSVGVVDDRMSAGVAVPLRRSQPQAFLAWYRSDARATWPADLGEPAAVVETGESATVAEALVQLGMVPQSPSPAPMSR